MLFEFLPDKEICSTSPTFSKQKKLCVKFCNESKAKTNKKE